jgi:hypothetical protein
MRIAFVSLIICFLSLSAAIAQVDTLQFSEIGSINLTGAITNVFAQDMNGDSFKEIILTTASNVYMYDHSGQTLLWQSPALHHLQELHFGDMNGDSFLDIGVRDDSSVTIFNPLNSSIIWTQPQGINRCYCFTIGDLNSDSANDLVVVTKEPFTRGGDEYNLDTCWVNIYDGPAFLPDTNYAILMLNCEYWINFDFVITHETPYYIMPVVLSNGTNDSMKIILQSGCSSSYEGMGGSSDSDWGGLFVNDQTDLSGFTLSRIGYHIANGYFASELGKYFLTVNAVSGSNRNEATMDYRYSLISANGLIDSATICHVVNQPYVGIFGRWGGYLFGDLLPNYPGEEFCYGWSDSASLKTLPSFSNLWTIYAPLFSLLPFSYHNHLLSNRAAIIGYDHQIDGYRILNSSDGASLAICLDDSAISLISDLNNDNLDEILSIQGNALKIYTLIPFTGIDDEWRLPKSSFLSPNFPNPFNSSTTIRFGLAEREEVRIDIFDILGRKIETLTDGALPAGEHEVVWNAVGRPSGLYFYSIEAPGLNQTRRMTLIK